MDVQMVSQRQDMQSHGGDPDSAPTFSAHQVEDHTEQIQTKWGPATVVQGNWVVDDLAGGTQFGVTDDDIKNSDLWYEVSS